MEKHDSIYSEAASVADTLLTADPEHLNNLTSDENIEVKLPLSSKYDMRYDLDNPDKKYFLPVELNEISGLQYYMEDQLICVQDESAKIYVLNMDNGRITDKFDFGKSGDYEDIALVGETVYVLRSDGRIFEVKNFNKKSIKTKEHNTPLSGKNDAEGLTYDKSINSLLIACKGSPSIDKDKPYKGYKATYQYDLDEMKLKKKPFLLIDVEKSDAYQNTDLLRKLNLKGEKKLKLPLRIAGFQPSAIGIHPLHDEIYIISGVSKMLLILNRQGEVMDIQELSLRVFIQPEGICFSPSGDMFISSEGQGGVGHILRFNLRTDR